jgi:hypothetical protein
MNDEIYVNGDNSNDEGNYIGTRKIWKTDVLGISPYVISKEDNDNDILCTVRGHRDAQEIANARAMVYALEEVLCYLSDDPARLKLSKEDLLCLIGGALSYQDID